MISNYSRYSDIQMKNRNKVLFQPLFVIGSPRSGTTLMRLILTCHSHVVIPPECGFLLWLRSKYGDFTYSAQSLRLFVDELAMTKKFETWNISIEDLYTLLSNLKPTSYAELCASVYLIYSEAQGKKANIWGDKNNYYINHLDELVAIYPTAKFLHVVRDGRDVACSYKDVVASNFSEKYAPKLCSNIEEIASEWSSNVRIADAFLTTVDSSNCRVIKYEDLVSDPESNVSWICEWLGVDYESQMLNFYSSNKKNGLEPEETLAWKKRTMTPISSDTVGRYMQQMSKAEGDAFLTIAGKVLSIHGYI